MKISTVIFCLLTTCFVTLFALFICADGLPVSIGGEIHEKYIATLKRIGELIARVIPTPPATKKFTANFSVFAPPGGKFVNFSVVIPSDNAREMFNNFAVSIRNVSTTSTIPE